MSWDVIGKAVNTDLNEPLNYLMWINDLAMFGENGYVYNNIIKATELKNKSSALYDNATVLSILVPLFVDDEDFMIAIANSEKAMTSIVDSELAMTAVVDSEVAMTAIVDSDLAMTTIFDSDLGRSKMVNSEVAMIAIANSEKAMTSVIDSEVAMTAVANSGVAMTAVFNSSAAKNAIWDSASASGLLMSNPTSRAWMVTNKQETYSIANISSWVSSEITGKIFVLSRFTANHYMSSNDQGNYRRLATGGDVGAFITSGAWQDRSDRVLNLEVWKRVAHSSAGISIRYVRMY